MEFCSLDHLSVHLATGVFRVMQECGPAPKEDIVMNLAKEWNVRWRDFGELLYVVGEVLQSGIKVGLMMQENDLYKVCEGYDYQQMTNDILEPRTTVVRLTRPTQTAVASSKDEEQKKTEKAVETETKTKTKTEASKMAIFVDSIKSICRIIFDKLV